MSKRKAAAFAAAVVIGAASGSAGAAKTSLGVGADYSTGDYGEDESTDIWFVPVTAKYQSDEWILKLTVPYIRITGPADVLPDVGRVGEPTTVSRTEEGLGDMLFSVTRTAYASSNLLVDLTGKVKLATADEDKGLGTGENDYSLQVDTYVPVGETTAFGTVGYKALGEPDEFELNDVWFASLGFAHKVNERSSAGAIADWREASSPRGDPRRELTVFATHKVTPVWSLQGYAVKGFSDGSPDWAAGVVVLRTLE